MTQPDRLTRLLAMLDDEPDDPFCLYGIAQEHANAGDHETAVSWYDRAIAVDPDDGYHYFHKARSLESLQRLDVAIATIDAGLAAARRGGDAHALAELDELRSELSE
jgi:tetratricopeptide (TPR) repeat protein